MIIDRSFIFQYSAEIVAGTVFPAGPLPASRQMSYASGYMNDTPMISRSAELMSRSDSALLVVDVQEKLIPAISAAGRVVWNVRRLIDAAKVLDLPIRASEQYPQGLGPMVAELASRLEHRPAKLSFSCRELPELFADLRQKNVEKLLVCGIETHVCVQQTVLDLLADGWRVYVAVDAVGSRHDLDHQTALRRMESSGTVLTSTEAALFEWCQIAGTPEFKQISRLVRETQPT
jgi:nicotinamidase-related amidase